MTGKDKEPVPFLVMVNDPKQPLRRYYGPFKERDKAEEYAQPLRGDGVHAVVQPLWPPTM